jgi:hypothetical protein
MLTHQRFATSKWYVLALIAAMTVAVPTTASAATISKTTFKGDNVYAQFESYDDCEYTAARVVVNNGENKDSVTGKTSPSWAQVSLSRDNYCSGESFSGFGEADLTGGQYTFDLKAGSATLSTTVPVVDSVSGNLVDVSVDLTWTAIAGPVSTKQRYRVTDENGNKFTYSSSGTSRDAIASGTVSAGGFNFTPGSGFGSLTASKSGTVTIAR